MRTWRARLVLLVAVYMAGFVSAVYCLAPPAGTPREHLAIHQACLESTAPDRVAQALAFALDKARLAGRDLVDRITVLIQSRGSRSQPPAVPSDPQ
ncbi:MAG: hypothetical protein KBE04_12870 [Phycisphaerae bacterium]|nr:hypothetical protein [Phycisphaerae bacterium]